MINFSERVIPETLICAFNIYFYTWNYLYINAKIFIIIVQHIMARIMFFLTVVFGNIRGK